MIPNKYDIGIEDEVYNSYINKIKNQIYKLLPLKEEKGEWRKCLESLLIELAGADEIFHTINFISLISKLEALKTLKEFKLYRKTIFEALNLAESLTVDIDGLKEQGD